VKSLAPPQAGSRSEGTWGVHDEGRMCVDERLPDFGETHRWWRYYFAWEGLLLVSESATDRSAPVMFAGPAGSESRGTATRRTGS